MAYTRRARYDVIGSNGPYDQRPIYAAPTLREAKKVAAACVGRELVFPEGRRTFGTVQVFTIGHVIGRLVATFGQASWCPDARNA